MRNHVADVEPQLAALLFQSDTFSGTSPLGYFGQSMAVGDLNNDTVPDLIVGSPGSSPDVSGSPNNATLPQAGTVNIGFGKIGGGYDWHTAAGSKVYGRFGWAVAVADLNCDGIDDLGQFLVILARLFLHDSHCSHATQLRRLP